MNQQQIPYKFLKRIENLKKRNNQKYLLSFPSSNLNLEKTKTNSFISSQQPNDLTVNSYRKYETSPNKPNKISFTCSNHKDYKEKVGNIELNSSSLIFQSDFLMVDDKKPDEYSSNHNNSIENKEKTDSNRFSSMSIRNKSNPYQFTKKNKKIKSTFKINVDETDIKSISSLKSNIEHAIKSIFNTKNENLDLISEKEKEKTRLIDSIRQLEIEVSLVKKEKSDCQLRNRQNQYEIISNSHSNSNNHNENPYDYENDEYNRLINYINNENLAVNQLKKSSFSLKNQEISEKNQVFSIKTQIFQLEKGISQLKTEISQMKRVVLIKAKENLKHKLNIKKEISKMKGVCSVLEKTNSIADY